jgi:hypothetical protein
VVPCWKIRGRALILVVDDKLEICVKTELWVLGLPDRIGWDKVLTVC